MLRYLIRRLLWACVLFIAVTFVTYVIFFVVPANPARLAAGQSATPERVHEVEHRLLVRAVREARTAGEAAPAKVES